MIAAAGSLNLAVEDFMLSTYSEVIATLVQARKFSKEPLKISVAEDYIEYRQLLKKIEERGTKSLEVANG